MSAHDRVGRDVDVLVVGAGPSGLAAAEALALAGAGTVEVVEREHEPGGIPRHSQHTGYGVRDRRRVLTGPQYAVRTTQAAIDAGAAVRTGVTVTGWAGPLVLDLTSPSGLERVTARAVVLATGARERPRPARWVPGDRPTGVWTTGQLQQAVYLYRQPVGTRAVVVGAEHVSFSAAMTLAHAGVRVAAMVTPYERQQSFAAFRAAAMLRHGFPLLTGTTVARLVGRRRLEAVEVRGVDGRVRSIPCDTVVFTGDWIPDHELAVGAGCALDRGSLGPAVDTGQRTTAAGVFAVGNLWHPVTTADVAALGGRAVAAAVLARLAGEPAPAGVEVVASAPLRWTAPSRVVAGEPPPRGRFVLWSDAFLRAPVVAVEQDGRVLARSRVLPGLVPQRPAWLGGGWTREVDPGGGVVTLSVR